MRVLQFPSQYRQGEAPYDIFKDRMAAISSITNGIKNIIANKFINKQNTMIAEQIQNEIDKQKAIDLSNLILSDPPDEIYPANLEDTIGQFIDKFSMGPMAQKETMMGNLPSPTPQVGIPSGVIPTGTLPGVTPAPSGITPTMGRTPTPGVTPTAPTEEAMVPKDDIYRIYNAVKELPTDQITWDNVYKKMTENKPFWMGATDSEKFVLNQMMEQVKDPRSKLASDINLSKLVKEAFYPEEERPGKYPYTREEVLEYESLKEAGKPDIKSILANIPEGFELSSINTSTAGTTSFSYKPKDTTTVWEFNTYDEAQEFARTHPQEGFIPKIETNKQGFDVNWYQKTGTTIKPPTIYEAKAIEETLMNNVESMSDMAYELDKLKSQGKDTSFYETKEYYAKLMKKKYDEAMDVIKYCTQGIKSDKEVDEDELNYKETYQEWYEKLKNYDQEYFNVTGKHLLEEESEIAKTGETNKILELAKEMIAEKKSLEDLDLDKVKSMGIDIEELKKTYMKLYLTNR